MCSVGRVARWMSLWGHSRGDRRPERRLDPRDRRVVSLGPG